jgi:hypothetical protein
MILNERNQNIWPPLCHAILPICAFELQILVLARRMPDDHPSKSDNMDYFSYSQDMVYCINLQSIVKNRENTEYD